MSIRRTRVPRGDTGSGGAMVQLYDNIASGAIASWDVSSISGSYNHLKLVAYMRGDTAATATDALLRFNNDSGANYDWQLQTANASSVTTSEVFASTYMLVGLVPANTAGANLFSSCEVIVPNYVGTTGYKVQHGESMSRRGAASGDMHLRTVGGGWRSTSAITRVTLYPAAGNFIAGSRLSIYGIL